MQTANFRYNVPMKRRGSYCFPLQKISLPIFIFFSLLLLPESMWGNFKHITLTDGLSQSQIFSITQDKKGFMWFGTLDGLNKYNGYDFKIYKRQPGTTNTLTDNNIMSICPGDGDILWIGTDGGGLIKFNTVTESFTHFRHDPHVSNSLSSNFIRIVYRDSNGILWIGTENNILNRMDPRSETFLPFPLISPYPEGYSRGRPSPFLQYVRRAME